MFINGSNTLGSVPNMSIQDGSDPPVSNANSTNPTITTTTVTSSRGNKTPPQLQKAKSYDDWITKLKVWRLVTCLPKNEQGGAILASLEGVEGEAEDAVLEMTVEQLTTVST